jgi:DNA-binding CsgD family transcriptional regulator
MLRGRVIECEALDRVLAAVREGQSASLVVRGEAGVGKSALLEYLVGAASGLRVVRVVGVESEMELAFAAVHQLCAPMLDRLGRLPDPQREALEVAFGLSAGVPPDRFLVALAVLGLLSDATAEGPLLCVVDDAQWLDRASAQVLAFVARRLLAESAAIVFAAREPGAELRGLPELGVEGLRNGDARALLSSVVRFPLDERVRDRIVAETRGNPLALLELPRGLTPVQLAGGFGLLSGDGLASRIEESFVRQLEELSEDARRLLLVAAAEPVGDPLLLWRAAERLGIEPAAADGMGTDELLTIGERVTFRHPLVRSAMYRAAAPGERRGVHQALAEVTDRETDPDRRAWHLAEAAAGPDEGVALELARSAGRAQARGGLAAAAAFLRRAVALTAEPAQRSERALAAAQVTLQSGAFDVALRLVATAEAGPLDELGRARIDLLRGQIESQSNQGGKAPALLLKAARQFESLDPALARETYLEAWAAALAAGRFADAGALREISQAAKLAAQPTSAARPSDLLLDGFSALVTGGRGAAAPSLRRAVNAFTDGEIAMAEKLRWGWLATAAACMLWDEESYYTLGVRQLQSVREAGLLSLLPHYLNFLGIHASWRGDFAMAASLIAEADAITEATEVRFARFAAAFLAGFRGREAEASALIDVEVTNATAAGRGSGIQWCQFVSGILHNGLGRYEQALVQARQASEEAPEMYLSAWALPELIEAATRTGETRLAVDALQRLVDATSTGDSDWGLGVLARSRALLSEGQHAEGSYREAIERLSRTHLRPELARAHLLYGEWLRRENRRIDARKQLRSAHDMCTAIGMEGFAERARRELQATGETVRARRAETRDELTAQERQVAQLARDGLTNPEIGARMFIAPRTVQYHLRKAYRKLNIKSRHELHRALPSDTETAR